MGKYFGTDGFRGEANVNLTVEHAYQVGRFLGWYYGKEHKAKIVIGKDTRRSSYMFEYSLVSGLTASGADVFLLHVTTTPSVSYVVRSEKFDCGIMISASHNPFYDNGIKVINGQGMKLEASIEAEIEDYIDGILPEIPFAVKENIGKTVDFAAGRNRYIGYLISIATRSFKDKIVALDCSNGSASAIAKNVFDALGAKTLVIHNEPDGTNINTDCGSTHINVLVDFVKKNKVDVGFAYDGDADRCIAVDENGNIVDGDAIMYVCGTYMKECGQLNNNTVVTTVMSNIGLYRAFEEKGIATEQTAVGVLPRSPQSCSCPGTYPRFPVRSPHTKAGRTRCIPELSGPRAPVSRLCRSTQISSRLASFLLVMFAVNSAVPYSRPAVPETRPVSSAVPVPGGQSPICSAGEVDGFPDRPWRAFPEEACWSPGAAPRYP